MILPEGVTIHIDANTVYGPGDECPDEIARAHGVTAGPKPQPKPATPAAK